MVRTSDLLLAVAGSPRFRFSEKVRILCESKSGFYNRIRPK